MSFEKLKVAELRDIAYDFGVVEDQDEAKGKKKAELIDLLEEEGVDFDEYERIKKIKDAAKEEDEETEVPDAAEKFKNENPDKLVLVRMDSKIPYYEVRYLDNKSAFKFSFDHPFQAMSEDEAQAIFDNHGGFRLATPKETKEYYN